MLRGTPRSTRPQTTASRETGTRTARRVWLKVTPPSNRRTATAVLVYRAIHDSHHARLAELADALRSERSARKGMWVQLPRRVRGVTGVR